MPQVKLNARFADDAKAPKTGDRIIYWDKTMPGFGLMVTANNAKSWVIQYRADGVPNPRRMSINGGLKFAAAKDQAKVLLGKIAQGGDPLADKKRARDTAAGTLKAVVTDYLADPVVKKLRSVDEKKAIFDRHILPKLGAKPIGAIRRGEIVKLIDTITEKSGPGAAAVAFKALARLFTWYAPRDDAFINPIVKGVFSKTPSDGARTLTDDEVRIIWNVASAGKSPYDRFIQFALLTATRLNEAAQMVRFELSATAEEWTIPSDRYKTKIDHLIPLSRLARGVLSSVPVVHNAPWVFTSDGKRPISGFSNFKIAFDRRLHEALAAEGDATRDRIIADLNRTYPGKNYQPFDGRWTTHSLRKTARTMLSRIGVDQGIAERCMGHVVGGIEGVYNHDDYKEPKRIAFEKLAQEIERITVGRVDNVVTLTRMSAT
jgi:integrase